MSRNSTRGFTLIEMAISLTILSLTLGGALTLAVRTVEAKREQVTNERMQVVMTAIKQFGKANSFLPCPSQANVYSNTPPFGRGYITSLGGNPGVTLCVYDNTLTYVGAASVNFRAGAVPTGSLGLNPIYMVDGWGNKFLYVVSGCLIYKNASGPCPANYYSNAAAQATIRIKDGSPSPGIDIPTAPPSSSSAAVVLISYGKNGWGAFPAKSNGTRVGDSLGRVAAARTLENANTQIDSSDWGGAVPVFRLAPLHTTQVAPTSTPGNQYFDDIVTYWTLDALKN